MATATYRFVTSVISGSSHFNASTKTPKAPASNNVALLFSKTNKLNNYFIPSLIICLPFLVNSCKEGNALDLISIGCSFSQAAMSLGKYAATKKILAREMKVINGVST